MTPERAALLLRRALSSGPDPEVEDWVLSALRLWWESGGSITIHRALGLPATPARATLLIRDAWLREAGKHVSGDTLWQRARALAHELPHASRKRQRDCRSSLDLCLAEAIGSGAPIPGTAERLYQILEANFQDDLATHALRCPEGKGTGVAPPQHRSDQVGGEDAFDAGQSMTGS